MDIFILGNNTLSQHEENIIKSGINIPFNGVADYLKYKNNNNEDWHHQAYKSYKRLHELKKIWKYLNRNQIVKESHYLYDCVYRCKYDSVWINDSLFVDGKYKKYTDDHPFSARMVMRIIMTDWPDFMNSLKEYTEVLHFVTNTIGITAKENQDVKVLPDSKGELYINVLTKDKYSHFKLRNKETNEIKIGLPFEIPRWFAEGEKKRLISDQEKHKKNLKKKRLTDLQDIAKSLDIDIFKKNTKRKKKLELIEEIINKNQHIIQDFSGHILSEEINNICETNTTNNTDQSNTIIESTNQVDDDNHLDGLVTELRNSNSSNNISLRIDEQL